MLPPFPGAGSDPSWEPDPLLGDSDQLCFSKQRKANREANSWLQLGSAVLLLKQPSASRKLWNLLLTLYVSVWLGHTAQLLVKHQPRYCWERIFFLDVIQGYINRLRVGGLHSSS